MMCFVNSSHRYHAVNDWVKRAIRKPRQDFAGKLGNQLGSLRQTAHPHRGSDDLQSISKDHAEIDGGTSGTGHGPENDKSTARREQSHILAEGLRPQGVDDHLHGPTNLRRPVLIDRQYTGRHAEPTATLQLVGRAGCPDDGESEQPPELRRRGSYAAANGMYQHSITGRSASTPYHGVPRGEKCLGDCSRVGEFHGRRNGDCFVLMHCHQFGVGSAPDQSHYAVANAPSRHSAANCADFAGILQSGNVGWPSRWRRIPARTLQQIRAIQSSCPHRNDDPVFIRDRVGTDGKLDCLRRGMGDCQHSGECKCQSRPSLCSRGTLETPT